MFAPFGASGVDPWQTGGWFAPQKRTVSYNLGLGCVVSHQKGRGFGDFMTHNTDKSIQNGPNLDQKRLSKVLFAARKCWQSAFLVTKMHFARVTKMHFSHVDYFLRVLGGRRVSSVGLWWLLAFVYFRLMATAV